MVQNTIQAHRIETTLDDNGRLVLNGLPFHAGQDVEVIILARPSNVSASNPYPLRGKPLVYEAPFEPAVPLEEWDALQ